MNRTNITHGVVAAIKYLTVFIGFAALAHLLPGELGVVAAIVFGLASAVKDTLSALEKRLESPEDVVAVASETLQDANQVLSKATDVVNAVKNKGK